jgi:putative sugar O-methyltransferase
MIIDENSTMDILKDASDLYQPSPFWETLARDGVCQLRDGGFENFKRTVNMKYFNWNILGIVRHQLFPVFNYWLKNRDWSVFNAKFPKYRDHDFGNIKSFNPLSALIYRVYVAMLWNFVSAEDSLGLLGKIKEPLIGNPFDIFYKGQQTSQDLCNSIHEFYRAGGALAADGRQWNVAELGAGYGRLGHVFLRALPASKYCVIDIPPALNLAQEYLSAVFPEEKIFRFRRFERFEDVREEFESSRIRFLAAHQIELLPAKAFDLVLNISSLHEMTSEQIENYLKQIDRTCRGKFYTKQWRVSRAKVNGFVIKEYEYPIPSSWKCIYHKQHPIQRMFFEALYEVPVR